MSTDAPGAAPAPDEAADAAAPDAAPTDAAAPDAAAPDDAVLDDAVLDDAVLDDAAEGGWHLERALQESERRYRDLFEAIDEGFCIIEVLFEEGDPVDYRFLEANPAFVHHTGLRDGVGRRIRELRPDHEDHWFEIYGRVALTGEPIRFTQEARELGGRWYDVYAFRVGRPEERRVAVLFNDVTRRKERERELREAKRSAERASEVKSQFLSTMSHELRTPLNAVIGLADLLESGMAGPVNEQQKEHLGRIRAGAWHLVHIIEEILTFSRTEADREQVRRHETDVAAIARDVVEMLRFEAESKDLDLRITGADQPLVVPTDGAKVRQVLTNLVGNAVKYTDEGRVEIRVAEDEEDVRFAVRDTGPGIAPESREEIFRPFEQVEPPSGRSRGGTGLGLTICRRLAELLGGEVEVESTPGEGSVFSFSLPLTR